MEKQVPCMGRLTTNPPDVRNWVFVDAAGAPIAPGTTPIRATLPMSEVGHIFDLVTFLNASLDACNAVRKANP